MKSFLKYTLSIIFLLCLITQSSIGASDITISSQPQNQTTNVGKQVTFSVTATGGSSLSYQWYKNGSSINGETSTSYITPSTTSGFNKNTYYVIVSDLSGTLQSSTATLTINGLTLPIGPSPPTTTNAVVRWIDDAAYKLNNGLVIMNDLGDISGINSIKISQLNSSFGYITNGIIFLQANTAPTALQIGGVVGSITNHQIVNVNGTLFDYWGDSISLYSKQLAP